jgi:hypothetical protein
VSASAPEGSHAFLELDPPVYSSLLGLRMAELFNASSTICGFVGIDDPTD